MSRPSEAMLGALAVCLTVGLPCPAAYTTAEPGPSLCVVLQHGCDVPGSVVYLDIKLGGSDTFIAGGQFTLQYDPDALDLLQIKPGHACDPASSFAMALFSAIDEPAGEAVFAVGYSPFVGEYDPQQPSTMACLSFLPKRVSVSDVCLLHKGDLVSTLLVDGLGRPVPVSNAQDCPPDDPGAALSCDGVNVEETCACILESAICSSLDTDCRIGICNAMAGVCTTINASEGLACDDGSECTSTDACTHGLCVGADCPNPSLCAVADDCSAPLASRRVAIRIGAGQPLIRAGQFSLRYDPQGLRLLTIAPGRSCDPGSPFTSEMSRIVDEVGGEIFYSAAVALTSGLSTAGPDTLACATFEIIDRSRSQVCLFDGYNPRVTRLVDASGQSVTPYNLLDCPTSLPAPITSCSDIVVCVIPAASEWGLIVLALTLLTGAKIYFGRR